MPLIFIVDDQGVNRRILEKLAFGVAADVRVRTFDAASDVFEAAAEREPDLIITDFNMPVMNGAEFIRELRHVPEYRDIPVIVLTVLEDRACRFESLEAGATDFLHNPVDHHEFLCRARNLLKLREQQQALKAWAGQLERKLDHSEETRRQLIRDNRKRLAQVVDTVPAIISAVDRSGRIEFVNAAFAEFFGLDAEACEGKPLRAVIGSGPTERMTELDELVYKTQSAVPSHEETLVAADGVSRVLLVTKAPLCDVDGVVESVLTTAVDITERKRAEEHLHDLAHFDLVTGLANRFKLNDQMRRELARARRGGRQFALHLVDLDHFKHVNDALGHHTGDQMLQLVAEKLTLTVRDVDTVARLGGDEFAIIQTDIQSPDDAEELANRLVEALSTTLTIDGECVSASGSLGIAIHPRDGTTAEELLRKADLAMYRAKENGRNGYCFYSESMRAGTANGAAIEADLRSGLRNGDFVLHFQPFVDLASGEINGGEALVRLERPGRDIMLPARFLPLAEENGDIVDINSWVLREACRQAVTWQADGAPLRVAVNLSPVQFRSQDVYALVVDTLAQTGLPPNLLELELTESIVMQNTGISTGVLRKIRDLGVSIAIDDFGTGYSSLSYVRSLPANRLKIDQSFIRTLLSNPSDNAIVRAVINLGHTLNMKIIAEGVETAEQVERLRADGCDEIQGHFITRPLDAESFRALCRERAPYCLNPGQVVQRTDRPPARLGRAPSPAA